MHKGSLYKKFSLAGPGGMKCRCCGGKNPRARQLLERQQRLRERSDMDKLYREFYA